MPLTTSKMYALPVILNLVAFSLSRRKLTHSWKAAILSKLLRQNRGEFLEHLDACVRGTHSEVL
jgi:hypothetical protein